MRAGAAQREIERDDANDLRKVGASTSCKNTAIVRFHGGGCAGGWPRRAVVGEEVRGEARNVETGAVVGGGRGL